MRRIDRAEYQHLFTSNEIIDPGTGGSINGCRYIQRERERSRHYAPSD